MASAHLEVLPSMAHEDSLREPPVEGRRTVYGVLRRNAAVGVLALCAAGCASGQWFARPLAGAYATAAAQRLGANNGEGEVVGSDFHLDVATGWSWPRLEVGLAFRSYGGIDYESTCRQPGNRNLCIGTVRSSDVTWIKGGDFLHLRGRLWPFRAVTPEKARFAVFGTARAGVYLLGSLLYRCPPIFDTCEDTGDDLGWSVAGGLAASYALTRWVAVELDVDVSAFWFDWAFERLVFVGVKAGPTFRF